MASRPISPAEPTKKHVPPIQPNAHPYAVKTTSSALLSRSNSSPQSPHHTRHHYVPSPFSQTGARMRHRHSSSLSSVEAIPAPLPAPPSIATALPDNPSVSLKHADEPTFTHQLQRAETVPPEANHSYGQKREYSHDRDSGSELYAGLPLNPKQWNTDELATYLERSLRLGNNTDRDKGDSSPLDILECVRTRGLTGRELLRLTDADLADAPLSDMQRAQLLERSRTLRANVLRGRIYVSSYPSCEVSDNSNNVSSRSARSSTPLHGIRGASVSVDDLRLLLDNNIDKDAFAPSPTMSLHRSNSVSDASAQRYRDLAHMRMRRRGKVKGLVETWERGSTSGSECSASEESGSGSVDESESEADSEVESTSDAKHFPESPVGLPSALHHEVPHEVRPSMTNSTAVVQEPPSSTPLPPDTHMHTVPVVVGDEEEELSIEELLASSSNIPLRGARAWEADFCLGETVRRIPASLSADASGASPLVMEPAIPHPKTQGDSSQLKQSVMGASTGSRRQKAKTQTRVVTAIFTGPPSADALENVGDEVNIVAQHRRTNDIDGVVRVKSPARSSLHDDSDSALQALEESITATRAQMEALRLRLEGVEAETAKREAELERAQYSDSDHFSKFELRRRRSEANEHTTPDTAELPKDEALVEGFRNRDVLKGWETMSTGDIARAIVAKAMGWVFPYRHQVTSMREDRDQSQARTETNDRRPSVKRGGLLPIARASCSIILFSFAICAAMLRRLGFGQWVRRP